jgi:hypothetical protein
MKKNSSLKNIKQYLNHVLLQSCVLIKYSTDNNII